jgi:hypothetical protein
VRRDQRGRNTLAPAIPSRKISETVIDFGAPVLADLKRTESIEVLRATFELVITVWNAHVTAMPVWGKPEHLDRLQRVLHSPGTPKEMIRAVHALTARRREHFAEDPRAVGKWSVTIDSGGGVRLHCDAHVPPSLAAR